MTISAFCRGNGDPNYGTAITNGPFCNVNSADCQRQWLIPLSNGIGPAVNRTLGNPLGALPTRAQVEAILSISTYDGPPWRDQGDPSRPAFRSALEGWTGGIYGNAHNGVHRWVGGTLLNVQYSLQDPIFLIHHAMVDTIWMQWQKNKQCYRGCYRPTTNDPDITAETFGAELGDDGIHYVLRGFHWDDHMYPWFIKVSDVADSPDRNFIWSTYRIAKEGEVIDFDALRATEKSGSTDDDVSEPNLDPPIYPSFSTPSNESVFPPPFFGRTNNAPTFQTTLFSNLLMTSLSSLVLSILLIQF